MDKPRLAPRRRLRQRPALWAAGVVAAWALANVLAVTASWLRALAAPFGATREIALDLRLAPEAGRVVQIAANRPHPKRGDLIGHLWVIWPDPIAPGPAHAFGFYADDQVRAAGDLALALLSPLGWRMGTAGVPGGLASDDGQPFDVVLTVRVDRAAYVRARAAHQAWAARRIYDLRPGASGRVMACQDYVFDVAAALGLRRPVRDWTQFPATSFVDLLRENALVAQPAGLAAPRR